MAIRSPILSVVGHVDHGKTTLLDKIRGTAMAKGEPGLITQYISASYIPIKVIESVCGRLFEKLKTQITIPGLLIIDTPGHEAFTTLRKRGGAIADMAILVVDINEGFRPQTDESLNFLKQFKTPFVVAATKIDRTLGWVAKKGSPFLATFEEQTDRTKEEFEKKFYGLIGQLSERGFEAERYDRISDYTKQVGVVPVSGITGEGVPDLLMVLSGIAQKYLKKGLEIRPGEGKGTILDVKEFKGLGVTVDVIVYDGEVKKGDWLVIGGHEVVESRIKALLEPNPLKELRAEKAFNYVDSVTAAAGIKIAAPGLENVIAGSPLRAVRDKKNMEKAKKEVEHEVEEVEIKTEKEGAILRADTLGSLEALIKSLQEIVPIRKALVGNVTKFDVAEVRNFEEPKIFVFGLKPVPEVAKLAKDNRVALFSSDVIYSLIEDYKKFEKTRKERSEERLLDTVTHPGEVKALKGFVFRQRKPAVFGVEVLGGTIKPGYKLEKGGKIIGEIKEIQLEGENRGEAKSGDKVAVSMPDVTIGKEVKEGDVLSVHIPEKDLPVLDKIRHKLRPDEIELLERREE